VADLKKPLEAGRLRSKRGGEGLNVPVRWQVKARVQNAVASLPFASNFVYYAIQRSLGGLRPGLNHPMDRFRAALRMVEASESAGLDIGGRRFVEIGTGHMVNVPTALWLLGAGETLTVDLNRYLSESLVAESNEYIRRNAQEVAALFGARAETHDFKNRLERLVSFRGRLKDLLAFMNVRYVAPCDARTLPLPVRSVDFHISNTVLEHIPPDVLKGILSEANRVLTPDGLLVHLVDPSDHFSHDDDSIAAVNFLRFSDDEWHRWAGNRFMYHNRLRAVDYITLFESAGARILAIEKRVDERSLRALNEGMKVAEKFAGLAPEDLATTQLSILARFDRDVTARLDQTARPVPSKA
jgi:SAM-dependent methyltransferase